MSVQILIGDARERLKELPDASVHCCVTSPPYFGLRDYGCEGQMGLEATPACLPKFAQPNRRQPTHTLATAVSFALALPPGVTIGVFIGRARAEKRLRATIANRDALIDSYKIRLATAAAKINRLNPLAVRGLQAIQSQRTASLASAAKRAAVVAARGEPVKKSA